MTMKDDRGGWREGTKSVLGGWVFRHATEFPNLHGAAEGILHDVLCQREVVDTEDPRESGHHAPGFAPKEKIARFHLEQVPSMAGDAGTYLGREKALHVQLFNRTHLHGTPDLQDGAAFR